MQEETKSEKLYFERSKFSILEEWQNSCVRFPSNLFSLRLRALSCARFLIQLGNEPVKLLKDKSKNINWLKFPNDAGIATS